jgi:poly-gamma-glutamate synthesis protein (capsule biosynthesis protein)
MNDAITILIAGDLVPMKSNEKLFVEGKVEELFGKEVVQLFLDADIRILNLECPLTDADFPIEKVGPNLKALPACIAGIQALHPSLVGLANNHIMDYGVKGLLETQKILQDENLSYIGAGINIEEAALPSIVEKNGIKIGVYACAEHEFSIATAKLPGANPFDPLESLDQIAASKSLCEYLVVLYHGGKEHYRYPSPDLQKRCRKMVEKGADLVVCQHTHCIGCYEEYHGATIVYGQGNFIFDNSESEFWETSLLLKVIASNAGYKMEYIPLVKEKNVVRVAKNEYDIILNGFEKRSKEILQDEFIETAFAEFSKTMELSYLGAFSGLARYPRAILTRLLKGSLLRQYYSRKKRLIIKNCFECEAHREVVLKCLESVDE